MNLLLLLSCTAAGPKPETNAPIETGETAVDTAIDTTDGDGADTLPDDTMETGDSVDTAPPTTWSPGEDVPGWEDADCTEPHPGRTYVIEYPDIFGIEGIFLDGMPGAGPHLLGVRLRDCDNFPCSPDTLDQSVPYVLAELDGTAGDDSQPRGLGAWGADVNRQVVASGRSMLIDWSNDGSLLAVATVTVCIERSRPDELRGTVRAEVTADAYPYAGVYYYDSLVYRFPFDVLLPDHAGFDSTQPDRPADQPLGYATAHFTYDQPYDAAWPWEDITDPSIREQLYDRYTPYNAP